MSHEAAAIPPENSDWRALLEDLNRSMEALDFDNARTSELMDVTTNADDSDDYRGIKATEEYLKTNFDKLSQEQRNYLLTSLRVKNYHLQNKEKRLLD